MENLLVRLTFVRSTDLKCTETLTSRKRSDEENSSPDDRPEPDGWAKVCRRVTHRVGSAADKDFRIEFLPVELEEEEGGESRKEKRRTLRTFFGSVVNEKTNHRWIVHHNGEIQRKPIELIWSNCNANRMKFGVKKTCSYELINDGLLRINCWVERRSDSSTLWKKSSERKAKPLGRRKLLERLRSTFGGNLLVRMVENVHRRQEECVATGGVFQINDFVQWNASRRVPTLGKIRIQLRLLTFGQVFLRRGEMKNVIVVQDTLFRMGGRQWTWRRRIVVVEIRRHRSILRTELTKQKFLEKIRRWTFRFLRSIFEFDERHLPRGFAPTSMHRYHLSRWRGGLNGRFFNRKIFCWWMTCCRGGFLQWMSKQIRDNSIVGRGNETMIKNSFTDNRRGKSSFSSSFSRLNLDSPCRRHLAQRTWSNSIDEWSWTFVDIDLGDAKDSNDDETEFSIGRRHSSFWLEQWNEKRFGWDDFLEGENIIESRLMTCKWVEHLSLFLFSRLTKIFLSVN